MALGAHLVRGDSGEKKEGDAATMLMVSGAEIGHSIDASAWGDERRMKQELLAGAKAVAAMAIRSAQHSQREDSTYLQLSFVYGSIPSATTEQSWLVSTRFLGHTHVFLVLPPPLLYILLSSQTVDTDMDLRAPFVPQATGEEKESRAAARMLLAPGAKVGQPIDPSAWKDEERMKKEIVAWAKAVASMAVRSLQCSQREDRSTA
ncbi:hypothetical protein GW17_00025918 [Ensete ventricosum]|nr:hypothetical protein GW17_00025918 [Ensete ventricosum]